MILYAIQIYSAFWGAELFNLVRESRPPDDLHQFNRSFIRARLITEFSPIAVLTSPFSFMLLFVGITSISGGISIWHLVREKELKSVKEDISSLLLTPEEKAIVNELKKANGKLSQNELVRRTGFSKVKVHRILVKLEMRKIVRKYPYGLTNKVVLEKSIL